jgi:RNA polymerase sigma factor (sigma-70 family)
MANPALGSLLHYLRRLHDHAAAEATDGELLRRHVGGDKAAFAALVRCHAPMVWGVCRRMLDNEQDAEDAFQAAFLVLLRKAESLRAPQSLAAFLHGVASRIARKAQVTAQRRRHHEAQAEMPGSSDPFVVVEQQELRTLLDEELDRLPEKYRAPLVLCYLEGLSYTEAARQLGWRDGTVCGRLARARELLRQRLSRRGLTLSGATLAAALTESSSAPAATVAVAMRMAALFALGNAAGNGAVSMSVATLAQGALHAMTVAKLKTALAMVALLCVLAGGGGLAAHRFWTAKELPLDRIEAPPPAKNAEQPGKEPLAHTDRYGDPLPPGALARLGTLRLRQQGVDTGCVVISPDGKTLATLAGGGEVRLWDIGTGKLLWRAGKDYTAAVPIFSPDGQLLAAREIEGGNFPAAKEKQSLCLLDAATGRLRRRIRTDGFVLAFSPDAKWVANGSDDDDGTVRVWQVETGRQVFALRGHETGVGLGAFTPEGRTLITVDRGRKIYHWNMADGTLKKSLGIAPPTFRALRLSPDGRTFAVVPASREAVRLYDTETGKLRCTLQGDPAAARYGVAFTPDGRTLVTNWAKEWPEQMTISLWNTTTGKPLRRFTVPDAGVLDLSCAPDGRTLATSGQASAFRLWDSVTGKPLLTWPAHSAPIQALAFVPDGRHLVSSDGQTLRLWEVPSGRHLRQLSWGPYYHQHDLAIAADGRSVLAGSYIRVRQLELPGGEERRLFLLDEHPEKLLPKPTNTLPGHTVQRLGLSADGRSAICISAVPRELQHGRARYLTGVYEAHIWDIATGRLLARRELGNSLHLLGITPGSTATIELHSTLPPQGPYWLEQEANSNQIVLRDLRTGRHRVTLAVPDFFRCHACAVSPDEWTLVTATLTATQGDKEIRWGTSTIRFWELASGKERMAIACPQVGWPFSFQKFAFAPDGRTLATARPDCTVQVWDAATGAELLRRTGSSSRPTVLAFAPDGQTLAAGNDDSTILLWDTATPKKPCRAPGAKELERWWSALAGKDAHTAWTAIWNMIEAPQPAVSFLRWRLRPAAALPADAVRRLLAELDSSDFTKRELASKRLAEFDDRVVPVVEGALKNAKSAELRRRLKDLLPTSEVVRSPEMLRQVRAVEVLERIGTPEARRLLEELASGAPEARLTCEAKAALQRLTSRNLPDR